MFLKLNGKPVIGYVFSQLEEMKKKNIVILATTTNSVDDVLALAEPVLKHRLNLTFSARADGTTIETIVQEVKKLIE